jgi:ubiquinone biosynthesis protein UbiJ
LSPAAATAEPQAVVRTELATLFRLAVLRDESARRLIRIEGDAALAAAFVGVLSNLRWDVEEDLSRVVGDVAARRAVRTGAAFYQWQAQVISNLASSVAEYAIEEQPLLAGRDALRQFAADVDVLREDVDRLGKRIELLISGAPRGANT